MLDSIIMICLVSSMIEPKLLLVAGIFWLYQWYRENVFLVLLFLMVKAGCSPSTIDKASSSYWEGVGEVIEEMLTDE